MFDNQPRSTKVYHQLNDVVVTTRSPVRNLNREVSHLYVRQDVVEERRQTIGKVIDVCRSLLSIIEIGLVLRFVFEFAAVRTVGFIKLIFAVTQPFVWLFTGIFTVPRQGTNVFDPNILVAMVAYAVIAWCITRFMTMMIEPPWGT